MAVKKEPSQVTPTSKPGLEMDDDGDDNTIDWSSSSSDDNLNDTDDGGDEDLLQECSICVETKEMPKFPDSAITDACDHFPGACLDCIATAIRKDLEQKRWTDLACPECRKPLPYTAVLEYADEQTRESYETLAMRHAMQSDPDFIWCASGCGSGQIHEGGTDQPIVRCTSCGHLTCFQHKSTWHKGVTCEEWDSGRVQSKPDHPDAEALGAAVAAAATDTSKEDEERAALLKWKQKQVEEDKASEQTIKTTTKPCPKCHRHIEKNGGCAHIPCTRCWYEFCWECMADFKVILRTDNTAHRRSCPFHTDNLP